MTEIEGCVCGWCDAEYATIAEAIAHMRRKHPAEVYVYLIGALEIRRAEPLTELPVPSPKPPRRRRVKP